MKNISFSKIAKEPTDMILGQVTKKTFKVTSVLILSGKGYCETV